MHKVENNLKKLGNFASLSTEKLGLQVYTLKALRIYRVNYTFRILCLYQIAIDSL
uniref:Uncharacterized protein n=1 Tax=Helianthus annuus TaxID=4232 RepID=A0A251VG89_HELAN